MRIFFLLLIAVLFSWKTAESQELKAKSLEKGKSFEIQGNWAAPDCGRTTEGVIFTRYFYLHASKKDITLLPYSTADRRNNYAVLMIGRDRHPAQKENDGILKIGDFTDNNDSGKKNWDDIDLAGSMEYANCPEASKVIPKIMSRTMRYIDRVKEECRLDISNDCARVMFKTVDIDANNKITPSELKRAIATALLLGELAEKKTMTDKQVDATAKLAQHYGETLSADVMSRQDIDKSGALDYNEMVNNFAAPKDPIVKTTLQKIGNLMPAFGFAAKALD